MGAANRFGCLLDGCANCPGQAALELVVILRAAQGSSRLGEPRAPTITCVASQSWADCQTSYRDEASLFGKLETDQLAVSLSVYVTG